MRYEMRIANTTDQHVYVDLLFHQFRQHGRDVIASQPRACRDTQSPANLGLDVIERAVQLPVNIQHALRPRQHYLTAFCQRYVPRAPMKQLDLESILQEGYAFA